MEEISVETVKYIAGLANVALTPEEVASLQHDLVRILGYFQELHAVDTHATLPLTHASELKNRWRQDQPEPCLSQTEALSGAPEIRDGLFQVPRILTEG